MSRVEDEAVVAAAQAGDEAAFGVLVEAYRHELQVHCYRVLGSYEDAEDLVQETYLRAWRRRETYQARSTFRAWLYRIATNACLDFLKKHPRQARPQPGAEPSPADIAWLQPYPDRLLDAVAPSADEPDSAVVAKETIELAFLAAIQHLPPRQRAVLILRDVLGWSAQETAALLEVSVASVKSALQRARPTIKEQLPARRADWRASSEPTQEERAVLQRFVEASERLDVQALAAMLREDAVQTMPPAALTFAGREAIMAMWSAAMVGPEAMGEWKAVPTRANRQPAIANYLRQPGEPRYTGINIDVLSIEDGLVATVTTFGPELYPAFGLPPALPSDDSDHP